MSASLHALSWSQRLQLLVVTVVKPWAPFLADVPEGGAEQDPQEDAKDKACAVVAGVAPVADEVPVGDDPVLGQVGLWEACSKLQRVLALLRDAELFYQGQVVPADMVIHLLFWSPGRLQQVLSQMAMAF